MPHCPAVSIMDTSGLKGSFEISNLSASWSLNQAEGLICDVGEGGECKQTALPMCRPPPPPRGRSDESPLEFQRTRGSVPMLRLLSVLPRSS